MPDTDKIIKVIRPFYQDFQDNTDKLFGSFSAVELKTLERYLFSALEIMNNKIEKINKI